MDTITIQVPHRATSFIKTLLSQLKDVKSLSIEENVVSYTVDGEPIDVVNYNQIVKKRLQGMKEGSRKTYSTEEIRKSILK